MKKNLVLAVASRSGRNIYIHHTILPFNYRISGRMVKTLKNILVYRIIFSTTDDEVDSLQEATFHPIAAVDIEIEKKYPSAIEIALLSGDFGQEISQYMLTEFHRLMTQQVTSSGLFNYLVEVDNKFKLRLKELLEKRIEGKSFVKKALEEATKETLESTSTKEEESAIKEEEKD